MMTINGQQIHYVVVLLFICVVPLASSFVNKCPSSIEGLFGQDILIGCNFVSPFNGVYWFDETDDDEPLIRIENGMKIGRGYSSGEYDVTSNGSLVIRDAKWENSMTFKVILLDFEYEDYTFPIKMSILEHCPNSQSGLSGEEATIVCHFKPGFVGVYWFEREEDAEPLIRLEESHRSGRGFSLQMYDIHNNGSLQIRRVTNLNTNTYTILLLNSNFDEAFYHVDFQEVKHCDVLSSPSNGSVNQTGMTAKFACDPGFHIQGHNILKCHHDGDTATYHWNGDIPRCVQESGVNATIATTPIINSVKTSQHLVPSTVYNTVKTSDAMTVRTGTVEDDGNYVPNQVEAGPTRSNHIPLLDDLEDLQGNSVAVLRVSGGVSLATLALPFILTFWN